MQATSSLLRSTIERECEENRMSGIEAKLERLKALMNNEADPIMANFSYEELNESVLFMNHSLDLCWTMAQSVFGDKAVPQHAFDIYDRLVENLDLLDDEDDDEEEDE